MKPNLLAFATVKNGSAMRNFENDKELNEMMLLYI